MLQADPNGLRYLAHRFSAAADELRRKSGELEGISTQVTAGSTGWRGFGAEAFTLRMEHLSNGVREAIKPFAIISTALQTLAYRVEMIQAKQQQLHRLQQERNSLHFGLNPEVDAEIAVLDGRIFLLEGEIAAERLFADSTAAAVFREIQVLQWLEDVLHTAPPPMVVDKPISIGEMKEEDYAFSNEDHEKLLAALKAYYMAKQPDYLPDDVKKEAIADDMKVMEGYTSEQLYDRLHDLMSNDEQAEYYEKLVQQKGFDAKQQWHNDPGYQGFVKVQLAQNESPGGNVLEGGMFFAATVLKLFSPKYAPDTGKSAGGGETDNQNLPNGARTKQEDEGEGSKEVGGTGQASAKLGPDELVVADKSFLNEEGRIDWEKHAPDGGYVQGTRVDGVTLEVGTVIDRYGSPRGSYTSPEGTEYGERALPYTENPNAYHQYRIVKPIENVSKGEIAPAFNQSGGGIQYELPKSIDYLLKNKYLEEIGK